MSLKGRSRKTKTVTLSDGDPISVRGLSLEKVVDIISAHTSAATEMFTAFTDRKDTATVEQSPAIIMEFASRFPAITAHIIAAGTGDETATEDAAELGLGDQVLLIHEIFLATFGTSEQAKNVFEIVINMIKKTFTALVPQNQSPLSI